LITPPAAFPLARLSAQSLIADRVALIGDAAHVVHPLAGQGVNLGFADAVELAHVLRAAPRSSDPGARMLLRRYERARAEDIAAMRWTTDGLARLFQSRIPGVPLLRNLGLNLVHNLPVLKGLLVGRAVGHAASGAPEAANPVSKV
jgi:2-octaprenylphenol hydroxylase